MEGLPCAGLVVKNPPASAGEDAGCLGRFHIPWGSQAHAQLLSRCSRAGEFQLLSPDAVAIEDCKP